MTGNLDNLAVTLYASDPGRRLPDPWGAGSTEVQLTIDGRRITDGDLIGAREPGTDLGPYAVTSL